MQNNSRQREIEATIILVTTMRLWTTEILHQAFIHACCRLLLLSPRRAFCKCLIDRTIKFNRYRVKCVRAQANVWIIFLPDQHYWFNVRLREVLGLWMNINVMRCLLASMLSASLFDVPECNADVKCGLDWTRRFIAVSQSPGRTMKLKVVEFREDFNVSWFIQQPQPNAQLRWRSSSRVHRF